MDSFSHQGVNQSDLILGTEGDDDIMVTAPAEIDGLGGFDTLHFDFSQSTVGIHLDLSGLWTGGLGRLNGHEIRNVEAVGPPVIGSPIENSVIAGSEQDDIMIVGPLYPERTILYGLGGDDYLVGSDGDWDSAFGHYLSGGSGDDIVIGGAAIDNLIGEDGDDELHGNGGDDLIFGDAGQDLLEGDEGNDYLRGGADSDRLFGGAGDDRLDGSLGSDILDGGSGSDWTEYYGAEGGVVVNLAAGIAIERALNENNMARGSSLPAIDFLSSIENAAGSFFDDILIGSRHANILLGDAGADRIRGGGGDDTLDGGAGADHLEGGAGADRFVFGPGTLEGQDSGPDVIADFSRAGGDLIDLSAIDAVNDEVSGSYEDDPFTFIGEAAFSGAAGELRISAIKGGWQVAGDVDGDMIADFLINILGGETPAPTDFLL